MSIRRFSSRTHRLDASFLLEHLKGARSYRRIAGYGFSVVLRMRERLEIGLGRKPTLAELSAGYVAFFKRATDILRPGRRGRTGPGPLV